MPITEALKKLIKTITGKNAVGETIEELIQNLNDNYPEDSGGQSGIDGVTMLHGHGAGAVPLPSGVVFPDDADVTPDQDAVPSTPYVKVTLLYIDGDVTDEIMGETAFNRVLPGCDTYHKSGNIIEFSRQTPDSSASFQVGDGRIELVSARYNTAFRMDINDNTDWMMMIVDMRQNGD